MLSAMNKKMRTFSKKRRKLGQNDEKTQATERFKGELLTRSFLVFKGKVLGGVGVGGSQNCRTDFENSVIRPVFYR